ncbi:MAG TPA: multicopper oxidase domain-containing protein [Desulfuromonadales bacterium]|nr:multicopper oxidase domain-containing protein [Desulfuromonadales bacterium]
MKNKPHILRFALATMLSCLWSVAAFAAPTEITVPGISVPVLDGATQPSNGLWDNVIPNALDNYYTYVPYTTADAVALGFPATCGNVAKGDAGSTEDCYTITVQSFRQALSLSGIFGGGPGLVDKSGKPLTTRAFGYGSGGSGWVLPYYDTTKTGVVDKTPVTGNAPAGPLAGGIWHFPAPTIKGAFGRPIRVQWLNELPNVAPVGLDPSVDCGPNAPNCFPYNRISTHVHGAHVGPESDGLASAWFTPNFATVGEDFVSTRQFGPEGTYFYPMDQEASTIWYHDHAMGTTHNNTNMGMAGFWPITDANEKALVAANILPTGAYELGFALQDRHFDAATGDMVMPDYPIYDRTANGCTMDINGLPDPATCPLVPFMMSADGTHLVPYNDPTGATPKLGGTSATLEYFGNIPVVNGVVYGNYSVEPRVYRMRFIGGTDSRTWVMKLTYTTTDAVTGLSVQNVIPFWQIGTEQGLLNNPVNRPEIDLMPGERVDVLVDFTGVPAGTKVMMQNLGGDGPWPGYFDYLAGAVVPSVDIPQIMAFNVVALTAPDTTVTPSAATNLRPLTTPVPPKGSKPAISNTRVVSLMEITDGFGRTMPTIDARGFKPVGIPVTEIVKLNDIEQWDIVNTTVDAHPMHLHQVAFKVIDRQLIDPLGFVAPTDDILNQVFAPAKYTVAAGSAPILPDAWDDGWKDTVASPPGYVTRVYAKFDLVGEYVWHCHILSHEEHDMMRNFIVADAANAAPAPAKITVPASSTTGTYTINWIGTAIAGVTYELQEATDSAFASATTVQNTSAPTFTATKTSGNNYYYRVRALPPAASGFTAGVWRTAANPVSVLLAPAAPTTLTATIASPSSVSLTWVDTTNNETGFTVQRATDAVFTTPVSFSTAANVASFTDSTVAPGATYFYRVATNAAGTSAFSNTATIAVPATLTITTASLPAATVATAYSTTVASAGGVAPYGWTVTGLPASLTFDAALLTISGTPALTDVPVSAASATFPVTISVQDSLNPTAVTSTLSLVINQILPAAPSALTATAATTSSVNLAWTDNSSNESGFIVTRTPAFATAVTVPANATTYTDTTAVAGTAYSYNVAATNGLGSSTASTASVAVPAVLAITTATLPAATVNAAYTTTVASAGGVGPYTWTASGLPAGLTFDAALLTISGTPVLTDVPVTAASATFNVNFTVTDTFTPAAAVSKTISLLVNQILPAAPSALTATTATASSVKLSWTDNSSNEAGFTVTRTPAFATAVTVAANATTYTDTTAAAGTAYSYSVVATNGLGSSAASNTAIAAVPAVLAITTATLPAGAVNAAYTATFAATGGAAPLTWSAIGLPAGLTMSTAGVISGTPTPANVPTALSATFPVTITANDSLATAQTASVTFNLVINQVLPAAPTLLTAKATGMTSIALNWVDNANNETGFSLQRATNATFTKGLITVALPANTITYADITAVAGTTYYYRIASSNIVGLSTYALSTLVTTPKVALLIAPITLPIGTVNVAYTATIKASGGVKPYVWTATGLPAGLTMAPATGVISGIPVPTLLPTALSQIFPITVTVTDGTGAAGVLALNLTIKQGKPAVPTLLTAVAASATQVNLSWTGSSNATGYTVQRTSTAVAVGGKKAKATTVTFVVPAGAVTYSDITAVTKTTYSYKVNATNIVGASAFTAAVTVTTP